MPSLASHTCRDSTMGGPGNLFLKHDSSIFRQSSNPVCGSWKSQASSPWAKQHRAKPIPPWINNIQGSMTVRETYSRALEQRTLLSYETLCQGGNFWHLSGRRSFSEKFAFILADHCVGRRTGKVTNQGQAWFLQGWHTATDIQRWTERLVRGCKIYCQSFRIWQIGRRGQRSILGVKPAAPSDIGCVRTSHIQSLTFKPVLADPASWWREEEGSGAQSGGSSSLHQLAQSA